MMLRFLGGAVGDYYVCATIDPYDVMAETNEGDHGIVTTKMVTVKAHGYRCIQ